ncbi:trehalose operon repressor [Caldalkalibacillus salinus]|uniref:trehalose operon repressor n=1 Tax=Caldalkalibacillus salinus TaxID=2803787 RepID=UPI001923FBEB|nr:trehalose operon repressor [Caldalkalibacillus salinus]
MQNKYLTIYQDIVDEIKDAKYKPDSKLPSENALCEQYCTSRETVRKALNLLSQNGYIQKVRGKGSIVLGLSKLDFPISGVVSFKELAQKMGDKPRTIVHQLHLDKPNDTLINHPSLTQQDRIWEVVRSREINGEKIILDKDYLLQKHVPSLTEEICADSIYEYLEKDLRLQISFAKKEIVVESVTEEDQCYLDVDGHDQVVVVRSFVYLEDTSLIQYTESRHRTDKFRFVDFARRHQP